MAFRPLQMTQSSFRPISIEPVPAEPVAQDKSNYFQRVAGAYKQAGQELVSDLTKSGAQTLSPNPLTSTLGMVRSGLRAAGAVAGAAFAPILEAPGIKQATEFAVNKVASLPNVENIIRAGAKMAEKYPEQARDLKNIVDIVTLGYAPKAVGGLSKESRAIGSDVVQGIETALTPSEQTVQSKVISLFQKSIKPTAKKTLPEATRFRNNTLEALKTIKANADKLQIEDSVGELVSRTPQTINELSQAVDQTKKLVFDEYDSLAKQAGTAGAVIDTKAIANEVEKVAQNTALQITNPEVVKYAENWANRLRSLDKLDSETTQAVIKNMNESLKAFYRNPTYDAASKVAVDAGIANNFRKALDTAIETATGKEYQALKNQYGALKAIENDVVRASMRDARKNVKGLLDYTDIFTGGQMISGALSLNPSMFAKGAVERGFKEWIKFMNDPNRAVSKIFDVIDSSAPKPFKPTSATLNLFRSSSVGNRSTKPPKIPRKVPSRS